MTDVFDRATEVEEADRADALAAQARRSGFAGKTVNDSALLCHVCDCKIPMKRRRAIPGVQTCVDCQTELETACKRKA